MTVRWNGTDRATTFASATELTAQIAAADVANSGTASVTVHDAGNTATSNALTFTIANVAPTATFAAPNSVAVGSPFTLALNGATDPSPADTTAGFTYAFDCGDGSDYGVFSTTSSASCPTSATGSRAVKGTVRDQDGGEREYTATVQVVALPATSLVVAAANGPYNGTATLAATLTLDGSPLAGKTVSFALNGAAAGSATTDSNGVATIASASLAGIAVGTYPSGVSASYAGEAGQHLGNDGTAALTVAKANQTITFAPLSDRVLGSGTFDVSATASSGLAVAFAASGNCTISGATVTLVAVGGCTITASQLGDASYNGAADVARTFQIAAPASGLTAQAATGTYGGTAALLATLLDDANQPLAGRSVAFTLNGTAVGFATTNASGVATLASVSLAGSDAGSYPLGVGAAFAGDADFAASADTAALTIERAALTVTANDATRHYGEANPTFTATYGGFVGGETTAALTGTLACATTATTASAPGSYPIACAGQTATNYAITFVSGTLTVTKAGQAITFAALADRQQSNSPFTVGATASSGLAVTFTAAGACTMSGATVTLTGLGTCTVTASQAGNANYSAAAPVARSFQVTANPPAQLTLALTVVGGGTVLVAPPGTSSTGGTFAFAPATTVTLTAQAGAGQTFTGWAVDGVAAGWAPSLTITMNGGHAVEATFAATETFGDVTGGAAFTAITELASRGTIRGYGGGRFGPADGVQRAQMAALIARAMPAGSGTPTNGTLAPPACLVAGSWDCEDWGTRFTDPGGIDPNLWRNAGTLQHYQVAFGYTAQDCERRGRAFPCYGPTDPVSHAQTIAFITRAMVAKGYWVMQPAAPLPYQGVPDVLATEVRTFHYYAGAIPDAPTTAAGWNGGANRGWFARALWAALDSYWGTDGELVDGRPAGGYVP
jgi:hypothetical protein